VIATVAVVWLPAAAAAAGPGSTSPTVGSTIVTRRLAVTLRAYRQPVGHEIAAIDVKVCNRTARRQTVSPAQFFLDPPDHHLVFPARSVRAPRPQLRATTLDRRRCIRGWLSYQLPAGTRATFVVFQAGAMFTATLHPWRVPSPDRRG
jgi:hypothetical protein